MAAPFDSMVTGLPATQADVSSALLAQLQASGSKIANRSPFSAFFVLLAAIFGSPVLFLRNLVLNTLLPGCFASTATGPLLDVQAADMDEVRGQPTPAVGVLTFTRNGTTGNLTVPAGTLVQSPPINGVVYQLATTVAGTILDGQSSVQIPAQATQAGAAYNLGTGYYSVLPVAVPGIVAVTNAAGWLTSPGTDLETDASLQKRLVLKWSRLALWHTEDTYRSLISEAAGIDPGLVFFNLSAPRGPGSADAYLMTSAGLPSAPLVQQVNSFINDQGNHGLGDDLQVKAIPALPVAVALTIAPSPNTLPADVAAMQAGITALVQCVFRENSAFAVQQVLPFQVLSLSKLTFAIMGNFPLVDSVVFQEPTADVQVGLQLPTLASLTVTMGTAE